MKMKPFVATVLILFTAFLAQLVLAQTPAKQEVQPITNPDVIEMVKAGLSPDVIATKIRHSPVSFDVSTKGLVGLKDAGVPESIVTLMIDRPEGNPVVSEAVLSDESKVKDTIIKELKDISTIYVKAQSAVIRAKAETFISENGGPSINSSGIGYDAALIIAVDCGDRARTHVFGATSRSICEGVMTVESGETRLWRTSDKETAKSSVNSTEDVVKQMSEEFVEAWKKAKTGKK